MSAPRREPGRALDAEIAERVLGAAWGPADSVARAACDIRRMGGTPTRTLTLGNRVLCWRSASGAMLITDDGPRDNLPHYSTDIAAAWLVRAEMERRGWESEDRLTWLGWGEHDTHPFGYSIWFRQWERLADGTITGREFVHHDHVPNFADAPHAICLAALDACASLGTPPTTERGA